MDEARIGTLIETIYTSAFEEDGWDSLLHTLRPEFHAAHTSVQIWDRAEIRSPFTASTLEPECLKSYSDYYHKLDPTYPVYLTNKLALDQGRTYTMEAYTDRSAWLHSEFYNDFLLRECEMVKPLICIFNASEREVSEMLIHLPPSGAEYSDGDRSLLRLLAPHLNRGLQLYRELEGLRGKTGLFETAFGALGAAFLLDASGCVLALNKKAERLLEGGGVLCLVNGRLGARHPADDAVLAAAFAPAPPGAAPADIVLRGGAYATGLRLAITPVKGRNIPLFGKTAHSERIAFMMTAVTLGPSLQNLMALYGLTRAEAEVALLLTEGLRAPQIAAHRQTSIGTVNTQLKQIYAKTGADGQVPLILKLLGR